MATSLVAAVSLIVALTPGVVRPEITVREVCGTRWGLDRRHVTPGMRRAVLQLYGVAWADRGQYELDHLIPRELGGADDVRNLWPQPWPEAHRKDQDENALHRAVCAGQRTLEDAQREIRVRWLPR